MTTTTWATTGEVPTGPWATLVADMRRLLDVMATAGSTIEGTTTGTQPRLDDETIAFTVTAPASQPVTVTFSRAAATGGQVTTHAPHTDGLVLVAVARAARALGERFTWSTDAPTTSRSVGLALADELYGAEDRAVTGGAEPGELAQLMAVVTRSLRRLTGDAPPRDGTTLLTLLGGLLEELGAERAGLQIAAQMLPTPPPAPPVIVVDPPSTGVVGEAGPEAVIPLTRLTPR